MRVTFQTVLFIMLFVSICNATLPDGPYFGQTPPGLMPQIFAPGIISLPDRVESNIAFTPDGQECFIRISGGLLYTRQEDGHWTDPVLTFEVSEPHISPDGQNLFAVDNADIWVYSHVDQNWVDPEKLGSPISTGAEEWHPTVTMDRTLYFCSSRNNPSGNYNIYRSVPVSGQYTQVERLDSTINSQYGAWDPFIAPDESYMVFSSDQPDGYGDTDQYISFRGEDNSWSNPINLGHAINSSEVEYGSYISYDGKYYFFCRFGGSSPDIYWVDAGVLFPVGDFTRDGKVNFGDFAVLTNHWLTDEPSADIAPSDGDGIVDMNDLCLFVDYWLRPILSVYIPPLAPTGLEATAASEMILLDWNDNNEEDLKGYNVYRSETSGSGYSKINGSVVSDSNYIDGDVVTGMPYYYVVTAVDVLSNESGYSNEETATAFDITPPAAPTGLTSSDGNDTVFIYWDNNTEDDVNGYNIYRSNTSGSGYVQINGTILSNPEYTDDDVNNGIIYYYVVTAVDHLLNESGYSIEDAAMPRLPIIYTFAGVTEPNTYYNAYACDVDVFPFQGNTGNRNTMVEATDSQYVDISADDTTRWTTADPGFNDEVFLWVEMTIEEPPASVGRIELTFKGYTGDSGSTTHSMYVKKTSGDWQNNNAWVQVGSEQSIPGGADTLVTGPVTSYLDRYISGGGEVVWGVYETESSESMHINYLQMAVYENTIY